MLIRRIRLVLLVVTTVLLQTALFPNMRIAGVAPDVALVAVGAVAYREGPDSGAIYGFAAGLSLDLFLETPFGLSALAFALTGFVVGVLQTGVLRTSKWITPLLGGLVGLFGNVVFIAAGAVVGQEQFLQTHTLRVVLIAAGYDALISPFVFLLAWWAVHDGPTARSRIG